MSRIEVVRGSELGVGDSTQGIIRRKAFDSETAIVSLSQVAPGIVSGWHHHGTRQLYLRKVVAVGDVVSRETYPTGIKVDLRIIDHVSMRKPTGTFNLKQKTTYQVRNPPGVIPLESWEAIKRAMKDDDAVILVDGEEDLLALPSIVESPTNSLVLYGQPSQGLVVVDASPDVKNEASLILRRMIREETS